MHALTIPNLLTLFRISLIPALVLLYLNLEPKYYWLTAAIFAVICGSDWLDGYLARTLKQESRFGAFLDPVADKLVVTVALFLIVFSYNNLLITIAAMLIVSREIIISALREWMAIAGLSDKVKVSMLGKVKTLIQMLSLILLLSLNPKAPNLELINTGITLLYLSTILSWASLWGYLNRIYRS